MLTQLWKSFDVGTFKIITCSTVFQPNKKKSLVKYMIKLEFPTGLKKYYWANMCSALFLGQSSVIDLSSLQPQRRLNISSETEIFYFH